MAQRIGSVIAAVLANAQMRQRTLTTIQREWVKVAGKALATHTTPISLRRGRLIIQVPSSAEGFALNYRREELLKRLQAATNGRVNELVFLVGEHRPPHADAVHR